MLSCTLVLIAAILNAFMDRVENENFYQSIFRNLNEKFWYKRISWKYAPTIRGYRVDAWHLAKSAMIVCMVAAVIFYQPLVNPLIDFILFGIGWNLFFNLFYNHIFKK